MEAVISWPLLCSAKVRELLLVTVSQARKFCPSERATDLFECPELSSFPISKQAAYFVEYAADREPNELEAHARLSGSIYVEDFINTVKRFFSKRLSASRRSPFVEDDRPSLPEIKWPLSTVSREKLRKDCGPDDISSQEEWIADILKKRKHFVSLTRIADQVEKVLMQKVREML